MTLYSCIQLNTMNRIIMIIHDYHCNDNPGRDWQSRCLKCWVMSIRVLKIQNYSNEKFRNNFALISGKAKKSNNLTRFEPPLFTTIKGAGVFMNFFRKWTFWLFLIEGNDIFQMLFVPWKNIVPSRSYRWSKVSAYV